MKDLKPTQTNKKITQEDISFQFIKHCIVLYIENYKKIIKLSEKRRLYFNTIYGKLSSSKSRINTIIKIISNYLVFFSTGDMKS